MDDAFTVESPCAAAVFQASRSRRIVLALVAREQSLGELASATGLSLTLLHYHVSRMLALGLIEVTGVAGRSGRPVKRYRAVARAFFVPSRLSTDAAGTALARELRAGLERDRARRGDDGVTYFVDDDGTPRMTHRADGATPGGMELWTRLSLTPRQVDALAGDLKALFATYAEDQTPDAPRFLAYCAFTRQTS